MMTMMENGIHHQPAKQLCNSPIDDSETRSRHCDKVDNNNNIIIITGWELQMQPQIAADEETKFSI